MTKPVDKFWLHKSLNEMTDTQWEALCDGCGRCCLVKLEDEDNGEIYTTSVSCKLLNRETCQCSDYENRFASITDCLDLKHQELEKLVWLPQSCAYRLIYEGNPLPEWHPLVSGDSKSTIQAGISIAGQTISEDDVAMEDLGNYLQYWPIPENNKE